MLAFCCLSQSVTDASCFLVLADNEVVNNDADGVLDLVVIMEGGIEKDVTETISASPSIDIREECDGIMTAVEKSVVVCL